MQFTSYSFGSVRVDGVTYDHDLIIDHRTIRKRKKAASRKFRSAYGHTPLCRGGPPVAMPPVGWRHGAEGACRPRTGPRPARRRKVDLVACPQHRRSARGRGESAHQCHPAPDVLNMPP